MERYALRRGDAPERVVSMSSMLVRVIAWFFAIPLLAMSRDAGRGTLMPANLSIAVVRLGIRPSDRRD